MSQPLRVAGFELIISGRFWVTAKAKHFFRQEGEGQRAFQQNCSRFHASPEGFSPRISGTIVRHMRVRASLSRHNEEALLRFFNS